MFDKIKDQSYIPSENSREEQKIQKYRASRPERIKSTYKRWTREQNSIYVDFLLENLEDFCNKRSRKSRKVFKRLSNLLVVKTPAQCKNHHQKKIKAHGSLQKIIAKYLPEKALPWTYNYHQNNFPTVCKIQCQKDVKNELKVDLAESWQFIWFYYPFQYSNLDLKAEKVQVEESSQRI